MLGKSGFVVKASGSVVPERTAASSAPAQISRNSVAHEGFYLPSGSSLKFNLVFAPRTGFHAT